MIIPRYATVVLFILSALCALELYAALGTYPFKDNAILHGYAIPVTIPLIMMIVIMGFGSRIIAVSSAYIAFYSLIMLFNVINLPTEAFDSISENVRGFVLSNPHTIFYALTLFASTYGICMPEFRNACRSICAGLMSCARHLAKASSHTCIRFARENIVRKHRVHGLWRSAFSFIFGAFLLGSTMIPSALEVFGVTNNPNPNGLNPPSENNTNNLNRLNPPSQNNPTNPSGVVPPSQNNPFPLSILSPDNQVRQQCLDGKSLAADKVARFDVDAISVDIVYNKFGQHDPNGVMYVLSDDRSDIERKVRENKGETVTEVEPLVIRANLGKCVEIKFTNHLKNEHASMHPYGLGEDPNKSDGMAVGLNKDTTVAPGDSIVYRWFPDTDGAFFFADGARQINQLSDVSTVATSIANQHIHNSTEVEILEGAIGENENASQFENVLPSLRQRGLFGTLMVEPPGVTWTDPITGKPLDSGVRADIHHPSPVVPDSREFVVHYHDGAEVVNRDGSDLIDLQGEPYRLYTINYRGDPIPERLNADNCPDGIAEEVCLEEGFFYSSWMHGEPGGGDLIFPAYVGDPVKVVAVGAAQEENHVHHLHHQRWKSFPHGAQGFETIDSQQANPGKTAEQPWVSAFGDGTVYPQRTHAQAFVAGAAGYTVKDSGDVLFHCHLFPHYGQGMWGLVRVLDKINSVHYERTDDNKVRGLGDILRPLSDRAGEIPEPTKEQPGFPYFIPAGEDGAPLLPPDPNGIGRNYTDLEWRSTKYFQENPNALIRDVAEPGAPTADPCPENAPVRQYNVSAFQKDVKWNRYGDHDPFARIYALEEERQRILQNEKTDPLFLRANVGDCIEIKFKNDLPGDPIQVAQGDDEPLDSLSMHIHFVAFNIQGSDGVSPGWNYKQFVEPEETINYRWYADEEGNVFWHDHASGIERGMHGSFGELIVEPKDSVWLNPETGKPTITGPQAIIAPKDGKSFQGFREFALTMHDFGEIFNKKGTPINFNAKDELLQGDEVNRKLPGIGSFADHGVMGMNYKNEPLYHRLKNAPNDAIKDPAYLFSSWAHGDPYTDIFKAYSNEPLKIRLMVTHHEEMHNMVIHGLNPAPAPEGRGVIGQAAGPSEQFTFNIPPENGVSDRISAGKRGSIDTSASTSIDTTSGQPVILNSLSARNDYLYSSYPSDDLWNGMWGIIRVWCDEKTAQSDGVKLFPVPGLKKHGCSEGNMANSQHASDATGSQGNMAIAQQGNNANLQHASDATGSQGNNEKKVLFGSTNDLRKYVKVPNPNEIRKAGGVGVVGAGTPPPLTISDLVKDKGLNAIQTIANSQCPDNARINKFDVVALAHDIKYNSYGDHDSHGIIYALAEDVEKIKQGKKNPEPLVIRANQNDCVVVNLKNSLPQSYGNDDHDHPLMPVECSEHLKVACFDPERYPVSNRISLHPQLVGYDVQLFDGANVGFNPVDQTIGPGESYTYVWHAQQPGIAVLNDAADIRGHRHHGAYAAMVIGTEGSTHYKPDTKTPTRSGAVVDTVVTMNNKTISYRDIAVLMADGKHIVNPTGLCIIPLEEGDPGSFTEDDSSDSGGGGGSVSGNTECNQSPVNDPEEQGFVSINYRSEPLLWRLLLSGFYQEGDEEQRSEMIAKVFSSKEHGDPNTPVFKAKENQAVVFRVSDVADKPRGFTFHMPGHLFARVVNTQQDVTDILFGSMLNMVVDTGATRPLEPGMSTNLLLIGGAGGLQNKPGDYIYQDTKLDRFLEAGAWGIFRVEDSETHGKDDIKRDENQLPEIKSAIRDIVRDMEEIIEQEKANALLEEQAGQMEEPVGQDEQQQQQQQDEQQDEQQQPQTNSETQVNDVDNIAEIIEKANALLEEQTGQTG